MTKTVLFSIVAKRFPDHINTMNAYLFNAISLGLGLGPLLGKLLFESLASNLFYCGLVIVTLNMLFFAPAAHYML